MNLGACRTLQLGLLSGTWYRALELLFLKSPLSTKQTKIRTGRFTPARWVPQHDRFAVLYLCENQVLALREVDAVYGELAPGQMVPDPNRSWAIINIRVQLQTVADLTDAAQMRKLGASVQELTGVWRWYNEKRRLAPTQLLAVALFKVPDLEGFLVPSAKSPDEKNLNMFPAKLRKGSRIRFHDPLAGKVHTLKGR